MHMRYEDGKKDSSLRSRTKIWNGKPVLLCLWLRLLRGEWWWRWGRYCLRRIMHGRSGRWEAAAVRLLRYRSQWQGVDLYWSSGLQGRCFRVVNRREVLEAVVVEHIHCLHERAQKHFEDVSSNGEFFSVNHIAGRETTVSIEDMKTGDGNLLDTAERHVIIETPQPFMRFLVIAKLDEFDAHLAIDLDLTHVLLEILMKLNNSVNDLVLVHQALP